MKYKIIENKPKEETWPRVMVSENGVIVLMNSNFQGMVIGHTEDSNKVFSTGTITYWNRSTFVPFDGSITLSND